MTACVDSYMREEAHCFVPYPCNSRSPAHCCHVSCVHECCIMKTQLQGNETHNEEHENENICLCHEEHGSVDDAASPTCVPHCLSLSVSPPCTHRLLVLSVTISERYAGRSSFHVAVFERSCSSPCSTHSFAWKAVLVFLVVFVLHCVLVHEDERSTRPLCIMCVCLSLIIFTLCLILCCLSLSVNRYDSQSINR